MLPQLKFLNPNIFANWWYAPYICQTWSYIAWNIKGPRLLFAGIRKFDFLLKFLVFSALYSHSCASSEQIWKMPPYQAYQNGSEKILSIFINTLLVCLSLCSPFVSNERQNGWATFCLVTFCPVQFCL